MKTYALALLSILALIALIDEEKSCSCKNHVDISGNIKQGGYAFKHISEKCANSSNEASCRHYILKNEGSTELPIVWKEDNGHPYYDGIISPGVTEITQEFGAAPIDNMTTISFGTNKDEYKSRVKTFIPNTQQTSTSFKPELLSPFKINIRGTFVAQTGQRVDIDLQAVSRIHAAGTGRYTTSCALSTKFVRAFLTLNNNDRGSEGLSITMSMFAQPSDGIALIGERRILSSESEGGFLFTRQGSRVRVNNDNVLQINFNGRRLFSTSMPLYVPEQ